MIRIRDLLGALRRPRFLKWIVAPHVVFLAIAWFTDAPPLIALLNSVDIALSVAVCIAFLPSVLEAVFSDEPADKAVFLTLGVFCGWEGNSLRSAWSMAWRALGEPRWFADTDVTSYILFVVGCGAFYHLISPGALDQGIPRRRWLNIGAWVGAGVFLALILAYLEDIERFMHHPAVPHDRAEGAWGHGGGGRAGKPSQGATPMLFRDL